MDDLIDRLTEVTNAHVLANRERGTYEVIQALMYILAGNLYPLKDVMFTLQCMETVLELTTQENPPFRVVDVTTFDGLTEQ